MEQDALLTPAQLVELVWDRYLADLEDKTARKRFVARIGQLLYAKIDKKDPPRFVITKQALDDARIIMTGIVDLLLAVPVRKLELCHSGHKDIIGKFLFGHAMGCAGPSRIAEKDRDVAIDRNLPGSSEKESDTALRIGHVVRLIECKTSTAPTSGTRDSHQVSVSTGKTLTTAHLLFIVMFKNTVGRRTKASLDVLAPHIRCITVFDTHKDLCEEKKAESNMRFQIKKLSNEPSTFNANHEPTRIKCVWFKDGADYSLDSDVWNEIGHAIGEWMDDEYAAEVKIVV